jgi:hypothetical protein
MKTSNQLFIAFLLLVFATPLLLALNLKNKIKNQEYVQLINAGNNSGDGNIHGSFGSYKVLKLVSPVKGVFACRLRPSKTASYDYRNYLYTGDPNTYPEDSKDKVRIYNSADTLYMEYIPHSSKSNQANNTNFWVNIEVNANLPSFEKLEIKGATAIIDSLPDALQSMEITLLDGGQLKMGEGGSKEEMVTPTEKTLTRISCKVADLAVHATGSEVSFGPYFLATHLQLNMSGASTLSVKEAIINKVDGILSDSITVNASWKYLRQLAPLTGR